MSEQVTSVEVDDLLASVRRLVSDKTAAPNPAPVATDKLVLTPSLRIDDSQMGAGHSETSMDHEVRFVAPSRPLHLAEMDRQPEEDTQDQQPQSAQQHPCEGADDAHGFAEDAEEKASEDLDALLAQMLPEGADQPDAPQPVLTLTPEDSVDVEDAVSMLVGDTPAGQPETPEAITPQPDEAEVGDLNEHADLQDQTDPLDPDKPDDAPQAAEDGDPHFGDDTDPEDSGDQPPADDIAPEADDPAAFFRSESHHDRHARLEATIAELEAAVQTHSDDFEPDGSEVEVEIHEWEDATPIEGDTAPEGAATMGAVDADETASADIDDLEDMGLPSGDMDEDALRLLISDVLREELRGEIGERITRNVRKLIRREIYRILTTEELER